MRKEKTPKQNDECLWPADTFPGVPFEEIFRRTVEASKYHNDISTVQDGVLAYATEALWPAIGAMALHIRDTGPIGLEGLRIEADPSSPRHRTDLLMTREGQKHAHYIFVCHDPVMNAAGKAALAALPPMSREDLIREILNPSKERAAIHNNPDFFRDPIYSDFVSTIGGTRIPSAPEGGFSDFRPDVKTPNIWWPGLSLYLSPNHIFHRSLDEDADLDIRTKRSSNDPYEELRVIRDLCVLLKTCNLGQLIEDRNSLIERLPWVQYGDMRNSTLISAGLRMMSDEGGIVSDGLISRMDQLERAIYAHSFESSLPEIRRLADDLLKSDPDLVLEFNDCRDKVSVDLGEGCIRLHVRNESGRFCVELIEDGSVRVLKGEAEPKILETLTPGPEGLSPKGSDMTVCGDIRAVRDRNGVLLSLQSVACQFSLDEDIPTP